MLLDFYWGTVSSSQQVNKTKHWWLEEKIHNSDFSLWFSASNGVVLATEKKQKSILYDEQSVHKVEPITKHIGMVYSGMGPDYRFAFCLTLDIKVFLFQRLQTSTGGEIKLSESLGSTSHTRKL